MLGVPAGFLSYEGLPSDHYLKIIGHAGKLIRGEVQSADRMPVFSKATDEPLND